MTRVVVILSVVIALGAANALGQAEGVVRAKSQIETYCRGAVAGYMAARLK